MKVSLKKAFSILDGRLSTEIGDVYEMLNYIFDENFMTHQLPTAFKELQEANPNWFSEGKEIIEEIKKNLGTNDFQKLMQAIENDYSKIEIELGKLDVQVPFFAGLPPTIKS